VMFYDVFSCFGHSVNIWKGQLNVDGQPEDHQNC